MTRSIGRACAAIVAAVLLASYGEQPPTLAPYTDEQLAAYGFPRDVDTFPEMAGSSCA